MRGATVVAALALAALAGGVAAASRGGTGGLVVARALLARLAGGRRAEATLRITRADPLTGRPVTTRGKLALELPGLARLDLAGGESLTLRADGGDWLQPATRQLIRAGSRSAAGALVWWQVFLPAGSAGVRETAIGPREYRLEPAGAGDGAAQIVRLGGDGLPRRMTVTTASGDTVEFALERWRFAAARGPAGFRLEAPRGYEVVEMP